MAESEPKQLSKKELEQALLFGGADLEDYDQNDLLCYCDKGQHKLCSLFHQPQHLDHWKKEEREQRNHHQG